MKRGIIVIAGPIGEFEYQGTQINGIKLVDVVSGVNAFGEINELTIQITSVGGRKDVGDQIYNYLNSLKPRVKIITEQIGIIASIGTKIFGVGDERIALEGESFMIHNPWTVAAGDSAKLEAIAADLKLAEDELLSFYNSITGVPVEGLKPLLDAETTFNADTALKLKFATSIKQPLKIAAMKIEAKKKITNVLNQMLAFLSAESIYLMESQLEDGSMISLATEDLTQLQGVAVTRLDAATGQQVPVPDGDYKLKDGRTIKVAGGIVTAVTDATAAPDADAQAAAQAAQAAQAEAVLNAKLDSLEKAFTGLTSLEQKIMTSIDAKFAELKSQIKTTHKPLGYQADKHADLVKEWDRSFKANEHATMRKENPDQYKMLYYAKYGKMPNI